MYASYRKRITESIKTVPHILEVLEGLRSVHTRRQVAATCRGDALQRQITSCVLENFVKIFVASTEFFWPQQVAQIHSDLIFCGLLQRKNSFAETKIFTKIKQLYKLYSKRFPFTLQPIKRPEIGSWTTLERRNTHFM